MTTLPQLHGTRFVTDGGLETDLVFHHGVDLPDFAAFPLLDTDEGRALLVRYYGEYAAIARKAGAGLMLESATWRANPDWGSRLGYDAAALARINAEAITLLRDQDTAGIEHVQVSGMVGPRGDGYASAGPVDPDAAAEYHLPQLTAFAGAGADLATALTLTEVGEAVGVVRAARSAGLPVAVSFTVETDGALPGGLSLAEAVDAVDALAPPDYFLVNCAHPTHIAHGLDRPGAWAERIIGVRANASTLSHAELDEAEELDEGDIAALVAAQAELTAALPALTILGGCCGTDHRHVAALWGV